MFFNKKKKSKLDPKVRFQNRQFNQKLQKARTFKRSIRPVAEGRVNQFLNKIGLGSRIIQTGVILLALSILYFVYVPNFLSLQNITVEGVSESEKSALIAVVRNALGESPFYNPQRNLLFLSKSRVQQAVMSDRGIDHVVSINKDYHQKTLHIFVMAKYEKFLVRTNDKVFDIYNDGTLKGEAGLERDSWITTQNPNMIKIDVQASVLVQNNHEFFTPSTVNYITELSTNLQGIIGPTLQFVSLSNNYTSAPTNIEDSKIDDDSSTQTDNELAKNTSMNEEKTETNAPEVLVPEMRLPINPSQMDLVFQKGDNPKRTFRVIVDTGENANDLTQRLNLLLSQTTPTRYNEISYIDLRVKNRAYVCLLNTNCD